VVLFIDDYASSLTIGNAMRPLTDRLRISREKLSYIIDSTAAPMATIGFVSTWIVFETDLFVSSGVITHSEAFSTFLHILPYSFYAIFTVFFVFLISVTGRDFGPMRKAEERTIQSGQVSRLDAHPLVDREVAEVFHLENLSNRWLNVVLPILSFLVGTILLLYFSGKESGTLSPDETSFWQIIGHAHTERMIFWGSIIGCLVAMGLAIFKGHLGVRQTLASWYRGCRGMFLAVMVLIFAWSMAGLCGHLSTGLWIESQIHHLLISGNWLPAITFVVCAFLSFATGSSWTTMSIMAGIVAPIAWAHPELGIHYGTLAAVLSGSIFGDHISPISDTTIISSVGAAADHIDHVKTQAPYGLLCALVALCCGFIPAGFGVSPWISLPVGIVVLWALLTLLGKKLQVAHDLV
jgi:Na+/H+ antiporter NhaC